MKKFFGLLIVTMVMGGASSIASAQDGPPPGGEGGGPRVRGNFQMPSFADLDKNKDKKISRDEMPPQMPPQIFDRLDENKDGGIDETEWNHMRERFGGGGGGARLGERLSQFLDADKDNKVSREEFARMQDLFDALDKDHDGSLSQEEMGQFFQAMSEVQAKATGGVEVTNLFSKYDKNKDGKLTADEMGNERTFKALDLNGDNSVDRAEAEQALKQLAEKSKKKQ